MQEVSLGSVLKVIYKRLWLIIIITVLATGAMGWLKLSRSSAQYEATGEVVLVPEKGTNSDPSAQNAYANQLMATSQDLVQSSEVLSSVSTSLNRQGISMPVGSLSSGLTITNNANSMLLQLKFKSPNQSVAMSGLKTIMTEFQKVAPKYLPVSKVAIVKGDLPVSQSSSLRSLIQYMIVGFVLGGVLSLIIVFVLEYSRHVVRDPNYLQKKYGVKTIQIL
ncbi:YveK family protein [Lacticaseibacillus sp. 53-4]|uniref:YveK family protein n=1 Tax=Lacticaseibacillus sp. 53-4 TaxID=2799575 RepID=UPI001942B3AD|nr:Wzz/FepE/Etk N-terminal domain-containing protein [Lacticaseibacillus sp. 53-4]